MRLRTYVACCALLVTACKDDKPAGERKAEASERKAVAADPALAEYIAKRAREDFDTLTQKLAAKTVTLSDCVVIVYLDELEPVDPALAAKLRRMCKYDVPVTLLETGVAVAEPARKAKPDAITLEACDINVGLAIEQLENEPAVDDKTRALIARYDAACPTMAKVRGDRAKRKAAAPATKTP